MNITNIYIGIAITLLLAIIIFLRWLIFRTMRIREQIQMSYIFTNITHELITPLTILSASLEHPTQCTSASADSRNKQIASWRIEAKG